jgi:hypothetical protein
MFTANAQSSNRDNIVSELNNLGTLAIQYYRKSPPYGGGGLSFKSWTIPDELDSTSNGIYSLNCTDFNEKITFLGRKLGNDESAPIEMIVEVTSAGISITIDN